jgi:hypothetical protein
VAERGPGDPGNGEHGGPAGTAAPFRSLLGAVPCEPYLRPLQATAEFAVGGLVLTLERAGPGAALDQFVAATHQHLKRRGYSCGRPAPAPVAGYDDGRVAVIMPRRRGRRGGLAGGGRADTPQIQLYAMIGPYALTLTTEAARAEQARAFGPVCLDPPVAPAVTPVAWLPAVSRAAVRERLRISRAAGLLTAVVSPGAASAEEYAAAQIGALRQQLPRTSVSDARPDVFLGGRPCVRVAVVTADDGGPARSEVWWLGVADGRGVMLRASGASGDIASEQVRRLRDLVVLLR